MLRTRRDFLKSAIAAGALSSVPRIARGEQAQKPHYIVQILLKGGFDPVLTIDPKDQTTKGIEIECGYGPNERLRGKQRLYGPLIGELLRHDSELCLLQGVHHDTVAHPDGYARILRGRTTIAPSTPLIGDLIGASLPGAARIEHLAMVEQSRVVLPATLSRYAPPTPSSTVVINLASVENVLDPGPVPYARPPWADVLEEDRLARTKRVLPNSDRALASVHRAAALQKMLAEAPRTNPFSKEHVGPFLAVALHAIKHDFAKYITVTSQKFSFDTHQNNLRGQRDNLRPAFTDIALFVDLLKKETNEHGPLYDQTTIVIGSEMGRYPKHNDYLGKDHWPENGWMLLGRGIRKVEGGLTIGATDLQFRGQSIDYKTGSLVSGDRRPIMIDALFATLLSLAGGDLAKHGYRLSSVLECVLA